MATCKTITKFLPAFVAWSLLLATTVLFFIYPCQFLQSKYHVSIVVFQGIITVFVISNFFLATFMDPGIIPKASPEEDDDDFRAPLFKSVEVNGIQVRMKWCITCKFYRPPRCSHCSECNNCIETFDHHCPWVSNCIGRRNYRHFFFFLIFLSVHMVTVFIWCTLFILDNKEKLYETESIVTLALIAIIVFLTIPIIGLTIFHVYLVSRGRTTNEQITGKFQDGYNPFTRGCLLNWCFILCGPKFPKSKKHKDYSNNNGSSNFNEISSNDKVVRIYLDNDDKSLIQKSSMNNKAQFLFNKNMSENKSANSTFNENGSAKTEKIDLVLESISRDCEPSPPATLKSQVNKLHNQYSNSKPMAYHNLPNNNQLTSSQSQVLYSQHYPLPFRNNLHSNSKNIQTNNSNYENTNEISLHLISQPGSHLINHPNFYHQFNARSTSPTKSTSIDQISPFTHHNLASKQQLIKSNANNLQQPVQSGVVVYYSPEEASNSLMITDLDNVGNKFASESELQKLHLIYNNNNANDNRSNQQPHHQPQSSSNKNRYFFSKQLRPMSFKKALEITEQLDRNSHVPNKSNAPNETTNLTIDSKEDNRHSQYEMNYEISV